LPDDTSLTLNGHHFSSAANATFAATVIAVSPDTRVTPTRPNLFELMFVFPSTAPGRRSRPFPKICNHHATLPVAPKTLREPVYEILRGAMASAADVSGEAVAVRRLVQSMNVSSASARGVPRCWREGALTIKPDKTYRIPLVTCPTSAAREIPPGEDSAARPCLHRQL
jgi:hypothetical protein